MNPPNLAEINALQSAVDASMSAFSSMTAFQAFMPMAETLSTSTIIAECFQGNPANCLLAIELAGRLQMPVLHLAQNLQFFNGKPAWSGKFVIALLNNCGRFGTVQYEFQGEPGSYEYGCRAWAIAGNTQARIDGVWVTRKMIHDAGWLYDGSPWLSMPDLMFRYRAASFFGNVNAPDILMGLATIEEVMDSSRTSNSVPVNVTGRTTVPILAKQRIANLFAALSSAELPTPSPLTETNAGSPPPDVKVVDAVEFGPRAPSQERQVDVQPSATEQAAPEKASPTRSTEEAPPGVTTKPRKRRAPKSQSVPETPAPSLFDDDAEITQVQSCVVAAAVEHQGDSNGEFLDCSPSLDEVMATFDRPTIDAPHQTAQTGAQAPTTTESAACTAPVAQTAQAPVSGRSASIPLAPPPPASKPEQNIDLAMIKELCVRASSPTDIAAVARQLPMVLAGDRGRAEAEVVEAAMIAIADESTPSGMEALKTVVEFLASGNMVEIYKAAFNGRCQALNKALKHTAK
jgi:hypothetical protein